MRGKEDCGASVYEAQTPKPDRKGREVRSDVRRLTTGLAFVTQLGAVHGSGSSVLRLVLDTVLLEDERAVDDIVAATECLFLCFREDFLSAFDSFLCDFFVRMVCSDLERRCETRSA